MEISRATGGDESTGTPDRAHAIALLSLLSGDVSTTRAVENAGLQEEIVDAVRQAAKRLMCVASPQQENFFLQKREIMVA
jgi:uncharacterized protein YmfQ (DUF2313 family)